MDYTKIYLEKCEITPKGILSYFRTPQFNLTFTTNKKEHNLPLLATTAFIGYFFECANQELLFLVKMNGKTIQTVKCNVINTKEFKIETPKFKGTFYFKQVVGDSFAFYEMESNNNTALIKFSRALPSTYARELFDGTMYYTDKYETETDIKKKSGKTRLPNGWEERITDKGNLFYVDHNTRTTHWDCDPIDPHYSADLERIQDAFHGPGSFLAPFRSSVVLHVFREFAIESSYESLLHNSVTIKNNDLKVQFINELGGDGGGLLREYMVLVSKELMLDKRLYEDNGIYDLVHFDSLDEPLHNPDFTKDPLNNCKNQLSNTDFCIFLGIIIAISLKAEINLDISFSLCFYENLFKRSYSLRKVQDVTYQRSLLMIKRGQVEMPDIKPDSIDDVLFTKYYFDNKKWYDLIRKGFYLIAPTKMKNDRNNVHHIDALVTGPRFVEISFLESVTLYVNCDRDTEEITYLWSILRKHDNETIGKFLRFCTGSSTLPNSAIYGGRYAFTVEQINDKNMLIRAATCVMRLWIGKYDSESEMERIIIYCLNETEGFHVI